MNTSPSLYLFVRTSQHPETGISHALLRSGPGKSEDRTCTAREPLGLAAVQKGKIKTVFFALWASSAMCLINLGQLCPRLCPLSCVNDLSFLKVSPADTVWSHRQLGCSPIYLTSISTSSHVLKQQKLSSGVTGDRGWLENSQGSRGYSLHQRNLKHLF